MATYGGAVAGVRALLPHLDIDAQSKPSETSVGLFLDAIRGRVLGRLGPLDALPDAYLDGTVGRRTALGAFAANVIELGAAAMTEDAAFPERSSPTADESSYGATLWARYREAFDELLVAAGVEAPGGSTGGGSTFSTDRPAASFPAPLGFGSVAW
jgi:hypothetical protein